MKPALGWTLYLMMLAGALDLSQLHAWQTSDSVLPSLVSLQAWTPFFWQQDRYGMLMPLVFGGITHPLYNQLAITWASVLGGLCAVMAVARCFFGTSRIWPLIGLSSIAWVMCIIPGGLFFDMLGPGQFFSTPLAMGLGGVELLTHDARRSRRTLAILLLGLAAWVNCVTPIWVGLLVAAKYPFGGPPHPARRAAQVRPSEAWVWGTLLAALGAGLALRRLAPVQDASLTDIAGPAAIATAYMRLVQAWGTLLAASPLLLWGVAGLLGMYALSALVHRDLPLYRAGAWRACLACGVYTLLTASERWVAQGAYHIRFWLPAFFVGVVACTGAAAGPWLHRLGLRAQRQWRVGLGCAIFVLAAARFGMPSMAGVRQSYRQLGSTWAPAANASHCTHLAGSYWRVWPAVFAANIERYEAGASSLLLGLTDRTEATVHLWPDDVARWRMCVPPGDKVALGYLAGIASMRFVLTEHGAPLDVWTTTGPAMP